jgi:hypothetical protein
LIGLERLTIGELEHVAIVSLRVQSWLLCCLLAYGEFLSFWMTKSISSTTMALARSSDRRDWLLLSLTWIHPGLVGLTANKSLLLAVKPTKPG